jgi:hypothetical protein
MQVGILVYILKFFVELTSIGTIIKSVATRATLQQSIE